MMPRKSAGVVCGWDEQIGGPTRSLRPTQSEVRVLCGTVRCGAVRSLVLVEQKDGVGSALVWRSSALPQPHTIR